MLRALSPGSWESLTALTQAWNWMQERPRFYPDSGGNQSFAEYRNEAEQPNRKQVAVIANGVMASLITVRLVTDDEAEIHVISPRKANRAAILEASHVIVDSLFRDLGVSVITAAIARYGRHEHKGTRHLAEACGLRPSGIQWVSPTDARVTWQEYEIRNQANGSAEKR